MNDELQLNYNSTYDNVFLSSFERLKSRRNGEIQRSLWASSEVLEGLNGGIDQFPTAEAEALFDAYLMGESITVSLNLKHSKAEFKRLQDEQRVWEFGLRKQRGNQWRIFGCFFGQDKFVALTIRNRNAIGKNHSVEAKLCIDLWNAKFGEREPMVASRWNDYLSGPVYDLDNADPF